MARSNSACSSTRTARLGTKRRMLTPAVRFRTTTGCRRALLEHRSRKPTARLPSRSKASPMTPMAISRPTVRAMGPINSHMTSMHRMTSVTDPDSVTSRTYYNPDSTVQCKQSAYQYSLDGATCGANSEDYTYDADANELLETHHFGQTSTNGVVTGITQKWYDGEDRLMKSSSPQTRTPTTIFRGGRATSTTSRKISR